MSILHNNEVKKFREAALTGTGHRLLTSTKQTPFSLEHPRLVNGFSLGCDPEFLLLTREEPASPWIGISATSCGLRVDEAFGADGAGTPVELRAHPSKFAVEVVASLLNTLRWMYIRTPEARKCKFWAAGSYVHKVSLGGHVHVGRKAGERAAEIRALNVICKTFEQLGFFRGSEGRRERGSYGQYGDYRKQAWGYEYRSYGCFLFGPSISHLLLTMTKLAALDPGICESLGERGLVGNSIRIRLENILKFYRFLDDDASIAFRGLEASFRHRNDTQNILVNWGLEGGSIPFGAANPIPTVPSTIPADRKSLEEVTEAIVNNTIPPFRIPEASWQRVWTPPEVPNLVFPLQPSSDPEPHLLGERDLLHGLFAVRGSDLQIHSSTDRFSSATLEITQDFKRLLPESSYCRLTELTKSLGARLSWVEPRGHRLEIGLSRDLRQNASLRAIKHLFESGILPVADSRRATAAWCEGWRKRLRRSGLFQQQ